MTAEDGPVRIGGSPEWTIIRTDDVGDLFPIADLLMAAAWADGNLDPRERDKALELLCRLAGCEWNDMPPLAQLLGGLGPPYPTSRHQPALPAARGAVQHRVLAPRGLHRGACPPWRAAAGLRLG